MSHVVRDEHGHVLCCHGRPMLCSECGEEYAAELTDATNEPKSGVRVDRTADAPQFDGNAPKASVLSDPIVTPPGAGAPPQPLSIEQQRKILNAMIDVEQALKDQRLVIADYIESCREDRAVVQMFDVLAKYVREEKYLTDELWAGDPVQGPPPPADQEPT